MKHSWLQRKVASVGDIIDNAAWSIGKDIILRNRGDLDMYNDFCDTHDIDTLLDNIIEESARAAERAMYEVLEDRRNEVIFLLYDIAEGYYD